MTIKQLRQAAGITQNEFCSKYSIPLKTLQNWESDSSVSSSRKCPPYVVLLLKKAVLEDFPVSRVLIETEIDLAHLAAINQAKNKIKKSPLSKFVKDVFLYGSTARGQAKPNSDIDILLVLDENVKLKSKYKDWITYLKGNISSYDFNSPETDLHVVFGENWTDNNNAYYSNIRKEGFSIWN